MVKRWDAQIMAGPQAIARPEVGTLYTVAQARGVWLQVGGGWMQEMYVVEADQAIQHFTAEIRRDDSAPLGYTNRGLAYDQLGQRDKALEDYDESIRRKSSYAITYLRRGVMLYASGKYDDAIAYLDYVLSLAPAWGEAYSVRGHAWFDKGEADKAVADWLKAMSYDPAQILHPTVMADPAELVDRAQVVARHVDALLDRMVLAHSPPNHTDLVRAATLVRRLCGAIGLKEAVHNDAARLIDRYEPEKIRLRFAVASAQRAILERLRLAGREVATCLVSRDYARAGEQCAALDAALEQARQETPADVPEASVLDRFARAATQLRELVIELNRRGDLPAVASVPAGQLKGLISRIDEADKLHRRGEELEILGQQIVEHFSQRRQDFPELKKQAQQFLAASQAVVAEVERFDQLARRVQADTIGDVAEVNKQGGQIVAELAKLAAQSSRPFGMERFVHEQAVTYRDQFTRETSLLVVTLQSRLAQREMDRVVKVAVSQEAGDLRRLLENRRDDLQASLPMLPPDLRPGIEATLAALATKLEECRAKQLDLHLAETNAASVALQGELAKLLAPEDSATRPARREKLTDVSKKLAELLAGVQAVQQPTVNDPRCESVLRGLTQAATLARTGEDLLWIQDVLSRLPLPIDSRHALFQADRALAVTLEVFDKVSAGLSPESDMLRQQTDQLRIDVSSVAERARPAIQFDEDLQSLNALLDEATAQLQDSHVSEGRLLLLTGQNTVAKLDRLVEDHASLRADPTFLERLAPGQRRAADLEMQSLATMARLRRAAGWIALPISTAPLVSPTAEHRRLRVAMLLDQGKMAQAAQAVDQYEAAHGEVAGSFEAGELRASIYWASGIDKQQAGDLPAARAFFQQAAQSAPQQPIAEAAIASIEQIDAIVRHERDRSWAPARRRLAIALGLLGLVVLAGILWRYSPAGHRLVASRWLTKAERAVRHGDRRLGLAHLARACDWLASCSADAHGADRLRERFDRMRVEPPPSDDHVASRVAIGIPDPDEVVDGLLGEPADHTAQGAAGLCVQWLIDNPHEGPEFLPRRRAVIGLLKQQLQPAEGYSEGELIWRALFARQCQRLLPSESWPLVYQARAAFWCREFDKVVAVTSAAADSTPSDAAPLIISDEEQGELELLRGCAYLELGQAGSARTCLGQLLKRPNAPAEAGYLYHVAWARMAVNKKVKSEEVDQVVAVVFGGMMADPTSVGTGCESAGRDAD